MAYIFDTCSIRGFQHIYPEHFSSVWHEMESLVILGTVISVSEVHEELKVQSIPQFLKDWISDHKYMFLDPSSEEAQFMIDMFSLKRFNDILNKKLALTSVPFADPFLIAKAYCSDGTIVTEERDKPNSVRIPTICDYYGVNCINLKQFMEIQKWSF
ncbi:MAG: DUF4411 family protein [Candidatus Cloacimonetes bacterium]|nr:DUF4411 family protein [Candidatus Cloacimonadota bacterium]MDY0367856.1 DUF4411 family protein [Candidatus Syntrophosphaera sp.]